MLWCLLETCGKNNGKNILVLSIESFKISLIVPVIELLEMFIFNISPIILLILKILSVGNILNYN